MVNMHEFSTICQIVDAVVNELKNKNVENVSEVWLEVGELTFLGIEQLKFAYEILTEHNILRDSKLVIKETKALVRCEKCKYKGRIKYVNNPAFHFTAPKFCCPKCNSKIEIIAGKECVVRKIVAEK
jgi:hydrogenase nickel incorporation protein HypA/HybF